MNGDTHVVLYAISTEPTEAAKTAKARKLLTTRNWAWSAQVAADGQDYEGVRVVNPFAGLQP